MTESFHDKGHVHGLYDEQVPVAALVGIEHHQGLWFFACETGKVIRCDKHLTSL